MSVFQDILASDVIQLSSMLQKKIADKPELVRQLQNEAPDEIMSTIRSSADLWKLVNNSDSSGIKDKFDSITKEVEEYAALPPSVRAAVDNNIITPATFSELNKASPDQVKAIVEKVTALTTLEDSTVKFFISLSQRVSIDLENAIKAKQLAAASKSIAEQIGVKPEDVQKMSWAELIQRTTDAALTVKGQPERDALTKAMVDIGQARASADQSRATSAEGKAKYESIPDMNAKIASYDAKLKKIEDLKAKGIVIIPETDKISDDEIPSAQEYNASLQYSTNLLNNGLTAANVINTQADADAKTNTDADIAAKKAAHTLTAQDMAVYGDAQSKMVAGAVAIENKDGLVAQKKWEIAADIGINKIIAGFTADIDNGVSLSEVANKARMAGNAKLGMGGSMMDVIRGAAHTGNYKAMQPLPDDQPVVTPAAKPRTVPSPAVAPEPGGN